MRLVEHVQHAGQARADLARQADALRLAAGERVGAALEAQVGQADVVEELQPQRISRTTLSGDLGLGPSGAGRRSNAKRSRSVARSTS